MKGTITRYRRKQLALITSGMIETIPKIKYIAFGDGGSYNGVVKEPSELQENLFNEVKRYEVRDAQLVNDISVRYTIVVPESDMVGVKINEMALVDESGNICAIKTFADKVKDESVKFTFEFDDEY